VYLQFVSAFFFSRAIIGTLDTLNRLAKTAEVQVPRDILANHTAVAATGES
jgi:hypothetical protein